MKKQRYTLYNIVLASVFSALTALLTLFVKIPMPSGGGYVHLGDSVIFIASCILPTPLAMISSAVGGSIADFLGGFPAYVIPTFIVKALVSLCFTKKEHKILCKKNIIGMILASLITIVGYYIADVIIMYGAMSVTQIKYAMLSSIPNIPWNVAQAVCSSIVFVLLATSLDKIQFKNKIFGGSK